MFYCKHHTSRDVPLLVRSGDRWEWSAKKTNKYGIRKNTNKSKDFVQAMMALHRGEQLASRTSHFTPKKKPPQYPRNREKGEPKSQSGCFREDKNVTALLGIKPQFVGCPACASVSILTTTSWPR